MSARRQAIEALRAIPDPVLPDLPFEVVPFQPEHAEGLARLFLTVYDDAYPIDAYYIPDAIRVEQESGNVRSMVARLEDGSIAGHIALYRSSPPFKGLLECGLGMTHPHYRSSFMLFFLFKELIEGPATAPEVAAIYGEAVCDTIATQHLSSLYGFMETGMELDLLPDKGEGRVSCLYQSRDTGAPGRIVHVPPGLEDALAFFMDGYEPSRTAIAAEGGLTEAATEAVVEFFDFAGVLRVHVTRPGTDFMEYVRAREEDAARKGCVNVQWFLNLGVPECGVAAAILLERGCFPAGFIPRWFDDDGVLLQKLIAEPEWERSQLYSDRAREILNRLRGSYRERAGA
ncbi:hypothetical protein GM415_17630 [Pseudodesulfovibrio cashew]|uniref:N-acetyltransferase domain-containing protein n=1 Tax=Pseudodesulfovibrio cashew TaxID=2678688 RepID=A0A6I6JVW3_9BACT|nr:hypothetical protein [Pseudodesulfovibrio cashew]QGY41864.1 hypothetical protein GM415_17630 [Pseudodesulfovibrio cashew]